MSVLEPRRLQTGDLIEHFDCGVEQLNQWLVRHALGNEEHGDSRTYVSIDDSTGRIAGYFSLASWAAGRRNTMHRFSRHFGHPLVYAALIVCFVVGLLAADGAAIVVLGDVVPKRPDGSSWSQSINIVEPPQQDSQAGVPA